MDSSWESVESETDSHQPTSPNDLGWGATCLSPKDATGGVWSSQERLLHIICKELLATWLGLQCYAKNMNCRVNHLEIDNTAAVIYQQDGRCAFERSLPVGTQDVKLVHRAPYNHLSGTSTSQVATGNRGPRRILPNGL